MKSLQPAIEHTTVHTDGTSHTLLFGTTTYGKGHQPAAGHKPLKIKTYVVSVALDENEAAAFADWLRFVKPHPENNEVIARVAGRFQEAIDKAQGVQINMNTTNTTKPEELRLRAFHVSPIYIVAALTSESALLYARSVDLCDKDGLFDMAIELSDAELNEPCWTGDDDNSWRQDTIGNFLAETVEPRILCEMLPSRHEIKQLVEQRLKQILELLGYEDAKELSYKSNLIHAIEFFTGVTGNYALKTACAREIERIRAEIEVSRI